jgi:cation diffusion facilitator CzcD-associated flavoprotein CzcO
VDGRRALARSGRSYGLDVLVLATGFFSTRPPFAHRIIGHGGTSLADHWRHGMTSHASTVVHGYPNLFVINGPNASLGHNSAVHMIETQIGYVLGALDHLGDGRSLEVRADAEDRYTRGVDDAARSTVWLTGGCTSWYRDEETGRLTLLWPGTATSFRDRNGTFDVEPFVVR